MNDKIYRTLFLGLLAYIALKALIVISLAANGSYSYTDANNQSHRFLTILPCGTNECSAMVSIDSTGTPVGTTTNKWQTADVAAEASLAQIVTNTGSFVSAVSKAQTGAAGTSLIAKASAGVVTRIEGSAASGSFIMLVDSPTVPTAGGAAVIPIKCWGPFASAQQFSFSWGVGPVLAFNNGIVAISSSTGCFTYTAVSAPFMSVEYQ